MTKKIYDLEERTAVFSENIILFCKKLPKNVVTLPLIDQLVRSATSVGANYCEANGASSKKDFVNRIYICKKESKESQYWLRLIAKAIDGDKLIDDSRGLWQEDRELGMIFSKIAFNAKT